MRSCATAHGSDRQSRRRPAARLSCSEHRDTPCLWCLLFACQDATFHLCPILPETHAAEARIWTLRMPGTVPSKPVSAPPSKPYYAINILCSFHPSCPPCLSPFYTAQSLLQTYGSHACKCLSGSLLCDDLMRWSRVCRFT